MKNARPLRVAGPFGPEARVDWEDATGGSAFYHARVTLEDGHLAVCSPVWVG